MKRILPILLLAGCASTQAQPQELVPLATTGITQTTTVLAPTAQREQQFMMNLRTNYPYPIPYSDEDTITYGWLWCQAYDDGMTTKDISDRIELGSNTQQEMDLQKAIVVNAFLDLCPS